MAPGTKSATDKQSRKKSSSRDAIRFFLGEKKGLKESVNRKVSEELNQLAEGVKRSSEGKTRPALPNMVVSNAKRQSRRFSMLSRRKLRANFWTDKTTVVYRSTRCLGQMLHLVIKQVSAINTIMHYIEGLKLTDPFGHAGFTQEAPQLVLALLSDMLHLTWMPAGLRGEGSRLPRNRAPAGGHGSSSSSCLGHCTAPAPVANCQNPPAAGGAGGSLAALFSATQSTAGQVDDDFCAYCQDVCWWFEMASQLCCHIAPASPPALPKLELSATAIGAFLIPPAFPKWCTGLAASEIARRTEVKNLGFVSDDHSQPPTAMDTDSTEPSEADLQSFPPTLRFIYQLLRCLMGKWGCAGVSYVPKPQTSGEDSDGTQVVYEGRTPRDPVVLRHLLECLNYLVRVGNALQNILNAAARAAEISAASASVAAGQDAPRLARPSGVPANAGASLGVQASFVLYMVEHCMIPSLWNLLTAEYSHLASWVVPLLLQTLTVPGMANVFWHLIEQECTHVDWKVRFDCMEKIYSLLRQLDVAVVSGFHNGPASKGLTIGRLAASSTVSNSGAGSGGGLAARAGRRVGAFKGHNANANSASNASGGYGSNLLWGGGYSRGMDGATNGALGPIHPFVINAIAHLFSRLIGSLDDYSSVVAQRTSYHLNGLDDNALSVSICRAYSISLHHVDEKLHSRYHPIRFLPLVKAYFDYDMSLFCTPLKCCIQCLEYHFDTIASDRTVVLQRMQQLSSALPNRQIFTWDFFIDRFGILSIGAQISGKTNPDIDSVTDLNNMNKRGDAFQQQFNRAVFAASGAGMLPSVSSQTRYHKEDDKRHENAEVTKTSESKVQPQNSSLKHTGGPGSAEFMDSANKFLSSLQLKLDQEGSDRATLHLWVQLLLRFMAVVDMDSGGQGNKTRRGVSTDEIRDKKALSKVQRHLALLLGYADQAFNIPPYKLRCDSHGPAGVRLATALRQRQPGAEFYTATPRAPRQAPLAKHTHRHPLQGKCVHRFTLTPPSLGIHVCVPRTWSNKMAT
ncbi:unnamed protein product [Mesocestoides corti]|uniref:Uncharacterized protein n=1 Tax=Mesocestoides corti TaxID=53468 RepID=A0A3P6HN85_MESCO|nr:unnamed protein product [Mesocestoides corti]